MARKKRILGIFFGIDGLAIAEIENKKLINQYFSPYVLSIEEKETNFEEIEENKLAAIIQQALKEKVIEIKDAVVSLPIKNIILRSFFMPRMLREELDTALEFEAKKYIPFKLEELIYDYQLFKIKTDKIRRLRVIFVGIKNELLGKYKFALEEAGLKIKYIEPSPISLLRALILKTKIDRKQAQALIEVNSKGGNIIISDNGIPTFINDFRFPSPSLDKSQIYNDVLLSRFANDIRLSVDYYHRQNPKVKISSIVLCPEEIPQEFIDSLKKEIDIPIIVVEAGEILGLKEVSNISLLHAYGAGLRGSVSTDISIDLYKKIIEAAEAEEIEGLKPKKLTPQQVRKLIQTGIIAATLVFAIFLFNLRQVLRLNAQLKNMSKKQIETKPDLRSLSRQELENKLIEVNNKLKIFSGIKKEKRFSPLLDVLPQLLPQGVWLKSLSFNAGAEGGTKQLNMAGSCFIEDRLMQINVINKFISNLKKDPLFSEEFKNIDINSIAQQEVDNWLVTNFEIICR